MLRNITNQTK